MSDQLPRTLPERPDLSWYHKRAKRSLRSLRERDPAATLPAKLPPKLADAQLLVAREYGFGSWRALVAKIAQLTAANLLATAPTDTATKSTDLNAAFPADLVKEFAAAFNRDRGDVSAIRALLDAHPELVQCHPWAPAWPHTAIEAAAHQCVWHRPKMHEIAGLLVERGATADLPTLARAGLLDEMKLRLDTDPSLINTPDSLSRTALYRAACRYGAFEECVPVIKELLARGAAVDIFSATSYLMIDQIESLLAKDRAHARAVDPEGLTALHWATRTSSDDSRQVDAARLLINAGADLEAAANSQEGMRPLHCAAEWSSSIALAELLIDRGAEINARTPTSRWTPLDFAMDRNREAMRDFLRSRGGQTRDQLDATDSAVADAFLRLVHTGDTAAVTRALDESPSLVNLVGKHPQWGGRPQALHLTIEVNDRAMFDLLLARGANPNGDNALYDLWSPLMLAVHWKRADMHAELLKRVHHVSLIDALMMGDDTTAMRIMQSGQIALQRAMPNDATMLHFARTPTAAERLLELGVPINAKDKYGQTALDLAATRGLRDLVDLLIFHGASASPKTFALLGDLARLKKAIGPERPIDPAILKAAITAGHASVVRWILKQGIDLAARGSNGATALHEAAWSGHLAIVKQLVKAGADIHALDGEHQTTPAVWARFNAETFKRIECLPVAEFLEREMRKT